MNPKPFSGSQALIVPRCRLKARSAPSLLGSGERLQDPGRIEGLLVRLPPSHAADYLAWASLPSLAGCIDCCRR